MLEILKLLAVYVISCLAVVGVYVLYLVALDVWEELKNSPKSL